MKWEVKKIGDICKTGSGGTPLKLHKEYYENGNIPWLLSGEVCQREITVNKIFITQQGLDNSSTKLFPINTVLVAMYGATAGQVGILRFESTTNQAVCGIYPNEKIIPEYLYYALLSKKSELIAQATGNAQPNISQIKIKNTQIPLPPLEEQKQIVQILDESFERIAQTEANTRQNLTNTRELFDSYLNKIFTEKGDRWKKNKLSEVCHKITDGTHQTPTYFETGFVFLSSRNVTSGVIDWDNIKYIDDQQHIAMQKRVSPQLNDILLAKNGTTGVAAIVDKDITFDIYVSLALLRPLPFILPRFLLHFVNSPVAKNQFNKRLKGIGVPNLHLREIREVTILYPQEIAEQENIVIEIDEIKDQTMQLEAIYQRKIEALGELKQSILQKAFTGQLT